ncbi:MAG: glycosyltransferase family 2 protein, partial [Solirubrobacterales bacterium]|nr:glycosyltransferase family 2 protein [Solirubrobacterales bacterium]
MTERPRGGGNGSRPLRLLSVVAPVYNEEATIEEFYARVCEALEGLPFELVLVDDGSTDGSTASLDQLAQHDPRVRLVYLSRNFGHQTALTAGLDHARGDAVVMLDADLQDPPELISTMLDHWRSGCDVVYAVRQRREGESRFKLATARWFYRLFDKLAQVELQHNSGDFRLLDRRALDALLSMRERNRFLRGMTVWVGYTQAAVPYHRDPRFAGETKFGVRRMLGFALDGISSFSDKPLRVASHLGMLVTLGSLLLMLWLIGAKLIEPQRSITGWTSVMVAVLFLGGVQLLSIGLLGEYVGRIFRQTKGRPLYVVSRRVNFDAG